MAWLFPHRGPVESRDRLGFVLARNIDAQARAGAAAEDVAQKAEESREHVEAAVGGFKARTTHRLRSRGQTLEQLLARDL